jgi:hypothetical protein
LAAPIFPENVTWSRSCSQGWAARKAVVDAGPAVDVGEPSGWENSVPM